MSGRTKRGSSVKSDALSNSKSAGTSSDIASGGNRLKKVSSQYGGEAVVDVDSSSESPRNDSIASGAVWELAALGGVDETSSRSTRKAL